MVSKKKPVDSFVLSDNKEEFSNLLNYSLKEYL